LVFWRAFLLPYKLINYKTFIMNYHKYNKVNTLELNESELKNTNGGAVQIAGAGAAAAGCGMLLGGLIIGVAIGVGMYYGVKWALNK
jgi:hypothetical protein